MPQNRAIESNLNHLIPKKLETIETTLLRKESKITHFRKHSNIIQIIIFEEREREKNKKIYNNLLSFKSLFLKLTIRTNKILKHSACLEFTKKL